MVNEDDEYNADMARWLEDSGRRRAIRLDESPEELIKYLEGLTGRKLTSREDILGYFKDLKAQDVERERVATKHRIVRETFFVSLLALSAAQYYYWDVSLQIATLQKVRYFVPEPATAPNIPMRSNLLIS